MKFSIPIFFHFHTQWDFPRYLAKFQSIMNIRTRDFWPFISENLRPPLFFLVPHLVWQFDKMTSFSQKYRRVKIIITINVENCMNIWGKVFVILFTNCCRNCCYNFNPGGILIWENDIIFSNSQPRHGTRKISGGRKFSQIKIQKPRVLMFVIDWNLARYLGKTHCVRKWKKMVIENLIIVALSFYMSSKQAKFYRLSKVVVSLQGTNSL